MKRILYKSYFLVDKMLIGQGISCFWQKNDSHITYSQNSRQSNQIIRIFSLKLIQSLYRNKGHTSRVKCKCGLKHPCVTLQSKVGQQVPKVDMRKRYQSVKTSNAIYRHFSCLNISDYITRCVLTSELIQWFLNAVFRHYENNIT